MALNVAIFKTRALTAIIFAFVMLVGMLGNAWSFIILFTIIHFGCWYEFVKLIKKIHQRGFVYFLPFGLIYITLTILLIIDMGFEGGILSGDMNLLHYAYILPCSIVFSIWINDTMAYIIGSFIGKTPLSSISPKKTWEGTIGGALLCVLVMGFVIIPVLHSNSNFDTTYFVPRVHWFVIAALCAVFGTLGDLLESKLKRMANLKDSGSLMPGHGGFLDRFDSLLIATPFVWLYIFSFMR